MSLSTFRLIAASLSTASLALVSGGVAAQSTAAVAGTYSAVSIPVYGDKPRGMLLLTPEGYYSLIITRADMPKIADTSTFPNWNGTTQKRGLKVEGDMLTYSVATPSGGGAPTQLTWERVK